MDELVIPATVGVSAPFTASYGGVLNGLDLSSTQGFRDAAVSPSDVDSIRIVRGELAIDLGDPRLNDLSVYIERLELFVESDQQPRSVLSRIEGPPAVASVELPLSDSPELKPYATDTGMRFGADLRLRTQPALNVRVTTTLTMRVDINLLGS